MELRSSAARRRSWATSLTVTCELCTSTPIAFNLAKARDSDFGLQSQPPGDQHLVVGQDDRARAVGRRAEGAQELRHALGAVLHLELLDLLHEAMKMLRRRCDHRQRNIRHLANAAHHVAREDAHHARIADRLGGRRIAAVGEGNGLGEAVALAEHVENRLLAGEGDPVELHPSVDDDEERGRRLALAEYRGALGQRRDGRRTDQALDRLRPEAGEDRDARDHLQISGGEQAHGVHLGGPGPDRSRRDQLVEHCGARRAG